MTPGNRMAGANPIGQHTVGGASCQDRVRRDLADILNALIRLEYDVTSAYESAIRRLEPPALKRALERQAAQHAAHIWQLQARVADLGRLPADSTDLHTLVDRARVALADLIGANRVVLAVKKNLEELRDAIKSAIDCPGFIDQDRSVLELVLVDSSSHIRELDRMADWARHLPKR